jgi:hypothetical protein
MRRIPDAFALLSGASYDGELVTTYAAEVRKIGSTPQLDAVPATEVRALTPEKESLEAVDRAARGTGTSPASLPRTEGFSPSRGTSGRSCSPMTIRFRTSPPALRSRSSGPWSAGSAMSCGGGIGVRVAMVLRQPDEGVPRVRGEGEEDAGGWVTSGSATTPRFPETGLPGLTGHGLHAGVPQQRAPPRGLRGSQSCRGRAAGGRRETP